MNRDGDPMVVVMQVILLLGAVAIGLCCLWLAASAIRNRSVFWSVADQQNPTEYGYASQRRQPVRYWAWLFIYGVGGVMLVAGPIYVALVEMRWL